MGEFFWEKNYGSTMQTQNAILVVLIISIFYYAVQAGEVLRRKSQKEKPTEVNPQDFNLGQNQYWHTYANRPYTADEKHRRKIFDDTKQKTFSRKNFRSTRKSKQIFTVKEAAQYLGVSFDQLLDMIGGRKGFPKLECEHNLRNSFDTNMAHTVFFRRSILSNYRWHLDHQFKFWH